MAEEKKVVKEAEAVKGGELLFCGATCWDTIGRRKGSMEGNLVSPTRLRPFVGVDIRMVVSGCASCHCVALDVEGRCYTWGRNEKGQLGHGDTIQRDRPTVVSELSKNKIIGAGAGRSHTVVVTNDGFSFAFGWNKHGQLGSGSAKSEIESSPVRCLVSEIKNAVCGADFTVWLSSVEGASILYGLLVFRNMVNLGMGQTTSGLTIEYTSAAFCSSDKKAVNVVHVYASPDQYNTKDSSVRLAYEAQPRPKAIASLSGETIVKVACGTNHTVAVDSNGFVYTWGFGGYGRLGHREQKDEWAPRRVDVFTRNNVLPPNAVISAGSVNSSCTAGGGQLYMWGKIKNSGDDWMYPKPLMDLSGWNIRCMDSGSMHHFVGADSSCISWGHAQSGELGYGPYGQKSSAVPKKVDTLEGMHVISVACGSAHSMVVVDRTNVGDRLDQLDVYDGKAAGEGSVEPEAKSSVAKKNTKKGAVKTSENSTKRKKSKDSSESEDEEEDSDDDDDDDDDDDSEGQVNGQEDQKSQRGGKASRGRGKAGGRGRGRPSNEKKSTQSTQAKGKLAKRGRPKKK